MTELNSKIQFLSRQDIDDAKWNRGIAEAFNGNIYAYSWYLDVVSPNWGALVADDYNYLFPLPIKKKFGVSYIIQPFFCQQLGLFSQRQITPELVDLFLDSIPDKFKYVYLNLNIHNKTQKHSTSTEKKVTYMLDLIDYGRIYQEYNQNTRRNILRAHANGIKPIVGLPSDAFVKLYKSHGYMINPSKDIGVISKLINAMVDNNAAPTIIGALTDSSNLVGSMLFAKSHNKLYYLFGVAEPMSRSKGVMFTMIDKMIKLGVGNDLVLDFEGSNLPTIARFFASFGSKPCNYLCYKRNLLPAGELLIRLKQEIKGFKL